MITTDFSLPVLSIRQPWAMSIVVGSKDVENRAWRPDNPGLRFRGRFLVHASLTMEEDDIAGWCNLIEEREIDVTRWAGDIRFADLPRGGIVGEAEIVDIVQRSSSPWFTGPWGLVIRNAKPVQFAPCRGTLGFFRLKLGPDGLPLAA